MRFLTHKGKTQCLAAWERELGLPKSILRVRLHRGWSLEDSLGTPSQEHGKLYTYKGETKNIKQWQKKYHYLVGKRLRMGWSIKKAIETPIVGRGKLYKYKGKTQCIADWAKEVGLKPGSLQFRLSRGWTLRRALTAPKTGRREPNYITHDGKTLSMAAWARVLGLSQYVFLWRVKTWEPKFWFLPKGTNVRPRNSKAKRYKVDGKSLTIPQWTKLLKIGSGTLQSRLDQGWSVKKTFTTPVAKHRPRQTYRYKGKSLTIPQWAKLKGINQRTLEYRIYTGWSMEKALNHPTRSTGR